MTVCLLCATGSARTSPMPCCQLRQGASARARAGSNTFDSSNTRHNLARILAALETPQTHIQLRAVLFMTERTLSRHISHLMTAPNRRVYIRKFTFVGSRWIRVFALGSRPDAVMPKKTAEETSAQWRAKVKASPELSERRHKYEKARWLVKRPKAPSPWFAALPGARTISQVRP